MTLDDARRDFPLLGFALYAYEPSGTVTLEIMDAYGSTHTFKGASEEIVFRAAFPAYEKPSDDINIFD